MALTQGLSLPKTSDEVFSVPSSTDSDLEAFSHNPTHDSFGASPSPATPLPIMRTTGSSRTEVDYCRDTYRISRVKLTCLTTV